MEREIYLAGGCFWGLEKYFSLIKGVAAVQSGYANGPGASPSYAQVCAGSGHAETVRVAYDADVLPLPRLLLFFYDVIDPCSSNRQGNDIGVQYRSGIYYTREEDRAVIEASLQELQARLSHPVRIEVRPLQTYSPAESSHQRYLDKNPGGYCHIKPAAFARARATQGDKDEI